MDVCHIILEAAYHPVDGISTILKGVIFSTSITFPNVSSRVSEIRAVACRKDLQKLKDEVKDIELESRLVISKSLTTSTEAATGLGTESNRCTRPNCPHRRIPEGGQTSESTPF